MWGCMNPIQKEHHMKAHWHIALATGEKRSILMRQLRRLALGVSFTLLFSGLAFAQYGGGSMGTGSSTPSYGSGKAIGIGVGAAAAGAGVVFLAMRHAGLVTGCVEAGDDGLQLVDAKNRTYSLLPGTAAVKAGQRVELQGKRSKNGSGGLAFQPKKVIKSMGACTVQSAITQVS